jgi:Extensin-like protein C-terminus
MAGGRTMRPGAGIGVVLLLVVALASCGKAPRESRPAWRDEVERACLRSGAVKESAYIVRGSPIEGPGACGALSPFHVAALSDGRVTLTMPASLAGSGRKAYAATLTCPMVPALEEWMADKVQTAAAAVYGQPVVEMHTLGSYSCRRMNNGTGTSMISEHAFADAIDVSGFTLADGREVMVRSGWRGAPEDQDFLRSVFVGSCDIFHTVLGPGSDGHHEDHFHLDLMRHASGHHICRPVIKFTPRTAAPMEAPARPPVAPSQMQQEPEADDPYALDDTSPAAPIAVATGSGVMAAPLLEAPPQRQPLTGTARPTASPVAASPNAPSGGPAAPVGSRGDRLDRTGAPSGSAGSTSTVGQVVAKDASRIGPGERQTALARPAYAEIGPHPMPARPRPEQGAIPPGWIVGAQPVARSQQAPGAPLSLSGSADPDL